MGDRFEFGKNWSDFLRSLTADRIAAAKSSLRKTLDVESLEGKTFLDVGSGSGLFSLAARQLGAQVHSFDLDPASVACTRSLCERYFPEDKNWLIEKGSALDRHYLAQLGQFDVVYSWGVLHHTGELWKALGNIATLVAPGGKLLIALYNDQGRASRTWLRIKKLYNRSPWGLRQAIVLLCAIRLWGPVTVCDLVRCKPGHTWRAYRDERGMSPWHDIVDWVGGYPFEVAKPEEVLDFCRPFGFELAKLKTCSGGHGCNEYLFFLGPR